MRGVAFILGIIGIYFASLLFITEEEVVRPPSISGKVVTKEVTFPNFEDPRFLRIYLPADYETSDKEYPVIYMHDGQNLFDDATSYGGEWGIDETLLSLEKSGFSGAIVVGIDNSGIGRMSEYAPWSFSLKKFNYRGLGAAYLNHVADVIKPDIDETYRTKIGPEHTVLAGSSMGGLISLYGGLTRADTFGKVMALSSTLIEDVVGDNFINMIKFPRATSPSLIYLDIGDLEADSRLINRTQMIATAIRNEGIEVKFEVIQGGLHKESAWRDRFADILEKMDL
ncbi:alpha/beta hydrolase-fold protein [Temperatibacter marinus]|uniref:Alpha/beta hydrolase-fold protein n=1 Tax=Temperatibacter marinus TaxID=1456591 RepID=A0AA52H952_9PROT|nr:alpha/beta hydrolase-fold protein [Temperatibacter marinus]WND02152.1 alpha/beta hydrolase-fold protein [Temperatibacter marinus]